MNEPTREELIQAIRDAHDAATSEYMNCPWCSGHIGWQNDTHDADCIWLKIEKLPLTLNDLLK
jgi:hypothetical protein